MSIDPKILKRMQQEDSFLQSQTKGSRRVKLERGQNWIIRFLPSRLGPDGLWYARIAKHWLNRLPIVCPRNTAEDYGGDPDFECPVCLLADELNESPDDVISRFGYKAKANAQYLTYCVVWEKNGVEQPMSEVLNPYEFNHYRTTYEELKGFYVAGARGKSPDSVLDYKTGNDFSVNKGKNTRLDKLEARPIFELDDPKFGDYIKKLEVAMKTPKVTIPTAEQVHVFAQKLQEAADRGGVPAGDDDDRPRRGRSYDDEDRGGRGRGRGRSYGQYELDRPRSRRGAPVGEPEDDLPYDDPPRRTAARAAAEAPSRRTAPEPERAGEAEEPSPRRRQAPADVDDPAPRRRAEKEPAPRREDDAPRGSPPTDEEDPPPRRGIPAREEEPARRQAEEEPEARRPRRGEEPEPERPRRGEEPEARRPARGEDAEPERPRRSQEAEPEREPASRSVESTPRRGLAPTERQASARREAAASAPQAEAEEADPLPEDDKDTVPPAPAQGEQADELPPVSRRGSQGADIKDRLSRLGRNA